MCIGNDLVGCDYNTRTMANQRSLAFRRTEYGNSDNAARRGGDIAHIPARLRNHKRRKQEQKGEEKAHATIDHRSELSSTRFRRIALFRLHIHTFATKVDLKWHATNLGVDSDTFTFVDPHIRAFDIDRNVGQFG